MQRKAFNPYKLNNEPKRWQPSEEILAQQEKQLIEILEQREQELRESSKKVKHSTKVNQNKVKVKLEATLKFSKRPKAEEAENKKIKLFFVDADGNDIEALINVKTWSKQVKKIIEIEATGEEWAGAVSGKLKVEDNGFSIVEAGLQIFEKKKKDKV
jgi:hypothetical protein